MKRLFCSVLTLIIFSTMLTLPASADNEGVSPSESDVMMESTDETEVELPEITFPLASTAEPMPINTPEFTVDPEPTVSLESTIEPEPTVSLESTIEPELTTSPEPTSSPPPTDPPASPNVPTPPANGETPSTSQPEAARFQIDNSNRYDGMDRAYKDGYVPSVADGTVTLVLPLIVSGTIRGNQITVTPNLGDAISSPIQYKNYQKTFFLADNPVNVTGEENEVIQTVPSYLVRFDFPLRSDRQNGTYPITLDIQATDGSGELIRETYICYVSITDAKVPDTDNDTQTPAFSGGGGMYVAPTEPPVSNPRILVSKYAVSQTPVLAGESFSVTVTLLNTSDSEDVQNMLVTVSSDSTNLVLKNDTNTIFLGNLKAGKTTELELEFRTDLETPAQRYNINLSMEFDDTEAMSMSSSGAVTVEVAQPVNVELSPFTMPADVNAGETIQMSFQVMNLGRSNIYNVRVELDVPGLSPSGNAFIGNMEPGTSATQTLNVFAGMKEGDERYGYTSGVVRLIYEDISGKEYIDEVNTTTNVKELVIAVQNTDEEQARAALEQARAVQWRVFMAAGALVIIVLSLILGIRKRNRKVYRHMKK